MFYVFAHSFAPVTAFANLFAPVTANSFAATIHARSGYLQLRNNQNLQNIRIVLLDENRIPRSARLAVFSLWTLGRLEAVRLDYAK